MPQEPKREKNFPFEDDIVSRFKKWTGIESSEVSEALKDLTGDTYFEMRKLVSILMTTIERLVESGKYCGYVRGEPLTESQKRNVRGTDEDLKAAIREATEEAWRSILNKQKVGVDKLAIAFKSLLNENEKTDLSPSSHQ